MGNRKVALTFTEVAIEGDETKFEGSIVSDGVSLDMLASLLEEYLQLCYEQLAQAAAARIMEMLDDE